MVVIILPYGDLTSNETRKLQLDEIIKHFTRLKRRDHVNIVISEQIEPKIYFNRGQLINAGIKYYIENAGIENAGIENAGIDNAGIDNAGIDNAGYKNDILILHDIDILPNEVMFDRYFEPNVSEQLMPYKSSIYKKEYEYKLVEGAAVYKTDIDTFVKVNGFPNSFWGWGGEDVALSYRYKDKNINLNYNNDLNANYYSTDNIRKSPKDKMNYVKKNKLRNMMSKELLSYDRKSKFLEGFKNLSLSPIVGAGPKNRYRFASKKSNILMNDRKNMYASMDLNFPKIDAGNVPAVKPQILSVHIDEKGGLKIIHLKLKLDEFLLKETIEHNSKIYEQLNL